MLAFVNCFGAPITSVRMDEMKRSGDESARQKRAAAKSDADGFHKGWRVTGVTPTALADAKKSHENARLMAVRSGGKPIEAFDEASWLRNAKHKPVRARPYGVIEAAQQCRDLAIKAGWLDVQIQEIKKGKS